MISPVKLLEKLKHYQEAVTIEDDKQDPAKDQYVDFKTFILNEIKQSQNPKRLAAKCFMIY